MVIDAVLIVRLSVQLVSLPIFEEALHGFKLWLQHGVEDSRLREGWGIKAASAEESAGLGSSVLING